MSGPELDAPVSRYLRPARARLMVGETVAGALAALRATRPAERIIYLYVVDGEGHLAGVVPTQSLLLGDPGQRIEEVMVRRVVTVPATATVADACELFAMHRLLALPVVDAERRLQGVVDIELYTDELDVLTDAEKRADLFQSIGVLADDPRGLSVPRAFLRRFPWLTTNLAGGLICAGLASLFQAELARVVALALFIPVVLNLAESVSSQSVSLTLHALHGSRASWDLVARAFRRELGTGAMLGIACGAIVGGAALAWLGEGRVALSLLGGIAFGVTVSALLGLAMPVVLRLLRLDPKVAAGPIALATADITTLVAYLGCARWLMG